MISSIGVKKRVIFSQTVCNEIENYFNSEIGKKIRSFVSFPLYTQDDKEIGILNIHRDKDGILCGNREGPLSEEKQAKQLSEEKQAKRFFPIIEPFKHIVVDLLLLLDEK